MPLKNFLLLLVTAFIWGTAFVGQSIGMDHVSPFTFTCGRSLIGGLVLIPFVRIYTKMQKPGEQIRLQSPEVRKNSVIGGIVCGLLLFAAESFQQFGLIYTPVGKAGFLTALYILFVPLISMFRGKKNGLTLWLAVFIAVAGLYCLSVKGDFSIGIGDSLCIVCAVLYALQVLSVDHYAPKANAVLLSCVMFFTGSLLGLVFTLLFESQTTFGDIWLALPAIIYVGLLSNGVAYTLQVIAQRGVNPTIASLIMSLESVFALLSGWVVLHEVLSEKELFGCLLMAVAIVLGQIPSKRN